jgi:transposase-like protein
MNIRTSLYKRHRFPVEIIQYAVWLYHRYNLSHRDIDELLAERGVVVSYETIQCDGAAANRFFRQRAFASWNNVVVI